MIIPLTSITPMLLRAPAPGPVAMTSGKCPTTVAAVVTRGEHAGVRVDALDGIAYSPTEAVLTLATWSDEPGGPASDYTGADLYYRSPQQREDDVLTIEDYLWRWDTD